MKKKLFAISLTLVFLLTVPFAKADWSSWAYKRLWNISNPTSFSWEFKPVQYNISFGREVQTKEIRITACSPENSLSCTTETEIPYQIINNTTSSAEIIIEANVSANSYRTFYIYYGNPSATEPSYSTIVWNGTYFSGSNWQTIGEVGYGSGYYPTITRYWIPKSSASDLFVGYLSTYGGLRVHSDYQTSCTVHNVTAGPIYAEIYMDCGGTYKFNYTEKVYKNFKPFYVKYRNDGTLLSDDAFVIITVNADLYCYDNLGSLTSYTTDANADWIFDNCREGWVQDVTSETNITVIFDETKISGSAGTDYYSNYESGHFINVANINEKNTYNNREYWFYADDVGFSEARRFAFTVKNASVQTIGLEEGVAVWQPIGLAVSSPTNTTYSSTTVIVNGSTSKEANITWSMNGNANQSACNNCVSFSNSTSDYVVEGANSVKVYAVTSNNTTDTTSQTVYFTVTIPKIWIYDYTNATAKNTWEKIGLSIYMNNPTDSYCRISVGDLGYNVTLARNGNWCNTTSVSLTGLSSGNNAIYAYGSGLLNNSYVVNISSFDASDFAYCRNLTINETTGLNRTNEPFTGYFNSSGWTNKPYNNSIRIVKAPCWQTGAEVASGVFNMTQSSGLMSGFTLNFPAVVRRCSSTDNSTIFSMYYKTTAAAAQAYSGNLLYDADPKFSRITNPFYDINLTFDSQYSFGLSSIFNRGDNSDIYKKYRWGFEQTYSGGYTWGYFNDSGTDTWNSCTIVYNTPTTSELYCNITLDSYAVHWATYNMTFYKDYGLIKYFVNTSNAVNPTYGFCDLPPSIPYELNNTFPDFDRFFWYNSTDATLIKNLPTSQSDEQIYLDIVGTSCWKCGWASCVRYTITAGYNSGGQSWFYAGVWNSTTQDTFVQFSLKDKFADEITDIHYCPIISDYGLPNNPWIDRFNYFVSPNQTTFYKYSVSSRDASTIHANAESMIDAVNNPLTLSVGAEQPALSVIFNYSSVGFGSLNHSTTTAASNQANGIYNVTVTSVLDYMVKASGTDFDDGAGHAFGIGNLTLDTNSSAVNLSNITSVSLSSVSQVIDSYSSAVSANFHGYWLSIPVNQYASSYTSIVTITYENV